MPTTVSAPETLSETRTQTRELLLQTALSMLEQGWFPSITELANASGVSRATAYRYFPSQAALVSTVVDESLGPVLQWQPTSTSVEARVNELLDFAYPRMEQHEGALRAALQVALHQWANERARRAQDEPKYRRGNRRRLLTLAVEPMVRAGVDPAVAERLAQALSLLYGTEAMVVLKDIWGLDFRQFMNVIKWMSSALVRATLAHAAFREARERQHVRAAVAELREEAHHRFRRMIGADHDAVPRARHRVLRDHPLARLDVAEHEILLCVVEIRQAARRERGEHRIGGRLHVDRERLVRAHEGERAPRVRFVVLRAVRQPHRDEARVVARCAQPLDGQLREPARRRRIDAAADAQHAGPQSGRAQIIGDEPDAALGFVARIERGRHVQFGGDRTPAGGLIGTGHRVLLRGGIEEPIIGGFARACRRRIRLSIRSSGVGNRSPVSDN